MNNKRSVGISVVGAVIAIAGLILFAAGRTAVGITLLGVGVVFLSIGGAIARKAILSGDGPEHSTQTEVGSGTAGDNKST